MSDPFAIEGPALISFSGGRSSGYMLWRILQASGGSLPDDIKVAFANTGKERPQTLDFVRDCGERWGVDIAWLEYIPDDDPQARWRRVDYTTASRQGEPFDALIVRKRALPNPSMRICTVHLKLRVAKFFCEQAVGWEHWSNVLGLRADEASRLGRVRANNPDNVMPLAEAGITKADVHDFWRAHNFDLRLPSIGNTTPHGNCDLCFLKGAGTISRMMAAEPELAMWWIKAEATHRFRSDRPSYATLLQAVQDQQAFDFGDLDELNDCVCGA